MQHEPPPIAYDEFGPTELPVPERNLYGAVIQRAVLDYQSRSKADQEHRRTARVFLFSDDPELSPLHYYAELLFTDPRGFVERLRKEVKKGTLRPKQVNCTTC